MTTKVNLVASVNADTCKVTINNKSRWATVPDAVKTGLTGGSVFIPILWNGDADYTFVAASSGTVSPNGITVDNLTQDVIVELVDAKVRLVVISDDPEAISSITPTDSYVAVNATAICQVTYNSNFDYHHIKPSVGAATANGLEIPVGNSDLTVTVVPNILDVYVANNNAKWASASPNEAHVRYGTPVSFNVTYTDGADASCLVTPVSTEVDGVEGHGVTVGTNTLSVPDGVAHGGNIILAPAKVQVNAHIACNEVVSVSPVTQYVSPGATVTATITYASGKSDSDISLSRGTVSGNTMSIPTSSSERYATSNILGSVMIGGRRYPTVIIGNRMWMAENLDHKWDGLTISTTLDERSVCGVYYMNDEYTYGYNGKKFGILYNRMARDYLITNASTIFPEGWRIPLEADFHDLLMSTGFTQVSPRVYSGNISVLHAPGYEWALPDVCTDEYGFHGVPSGLKISSGGSFQWKRMAFHVLVSGYEPSGPTDYSNYGCIETWSQNEIKFDFNNWYYRPYEYAIRLVKDI